MNERTPSGSEYNKPVRLQCCRAPVRNFTFTLPSSADVAESGSLNLPEPSGPHRPVMGLLYPFLICVCLLLLPLYSMSSSVLDANTVCLEVGCIGDPNVIFGLKFIRTMKCNIWRRFKLPPLQRHRALSETSLTSQTDRCIIGTAVNVPDLKMYVNYTDRKKLHCLVYLNASGELRHSRQCHEHFRINPASS
jgi:hypothetical protein